MFVKNREELLKLAKNKEEGEIIATLVDLVDKTIEYAQPSNLLSAKVKINKETMIIEDKAYKLSNYERFYLIAFGKASLSMAKWMIEKFPHQFEEIIVAGLENQIHLNGAKYFRCGHPYPNEGSIKAASYILKTLKLLSEKDLCIVLISGGGSAILERPAYGIGLEEYKSLINKLLFSGATINEINIIRKHFSEIKGGKLATSSKATIVSLIISDVIGNDLSVIASGPTVPDRSSWEDVHELFRKYRLHDELPSIFNAIIQGGIEGKIEDTPANRSLFQHVHNHLIGSNDLLITYLENYMASKNLLSKRLQYPIQGEARDVGRKLVREIEKMLKRDTISSKKFRILITGGETTVTIPYNVNPGAGGRNQELALSFAIESRNKPYYLVSIGTDGVDGNSNAAGALITPHTISSPKILEDAKLFQSKYDTNSFFKKYGGGIITGLTGTNLMDVIICLVNN